MLCLYKLVGFFVFLIQFSSLYLIFLEVLNLFLEKDVEKLDNKLSSFRCKVKADGQFASKWLIVKINLVYHR